MKYTSAIGFNPRARAGRDIVAVPVVPAVVFQSTRPRRARRKPSRQIPYRVVSIHAPAQGATPVPVQTLPVAPVSIHAPAQGATFWFREFQVAGLSFNPRARAGRDLLGQQ